MNEKMKAALSLTAECPPIEQLAALAQSSHVSQCLHCQAELAMLQKFENATADADEKDAVDWIAARIQPVEPPRRRLLSFPLKRESRIWMAAAACLLLAVSGGVLMFRGPGEPVAPKEGTEILRTQSVELVAPLNEVSALPGEFTWHSVAGAASYRVRLLEVDRRELWSTVVTRAEGCCAGGRTEPDSTGHGPALGSERA